MFISGLICFSGVTDKTITASKLFYKILKIVWIWIKTGHWEKSSIRLFSLPPKAKKFIYGTLVILFWVMFLLFLKYSGITLGGVPYGLITLFFLWLFSKAIGRNFMNWKISGKK